MMRPKQFSSYPSRQDLDKKKINKYIPTTEAAEIILNYFIYNNFQDFNTWQQIAKTKLQYDYTETIKTNFVCTVTLNWQDKQNPTFIKVAEGTTKKQSKRKALQKLIKDIMYQGYIGFGFKEPDFIKKIPRRQKQDSSQSQQEQKHQQLTVKHNKQFQLLNQNKFQDALQTVSPQNIWLIWSYALSRKDLKLCASVISRLLGSEVSDKIWQEDCEKQSGKVQEKIPQISEFVDPLLDDLTELLQYYQLQQSQQISKQESKLKISPVLLPSESFQKSQLQRTSWKFIQIFHPICSKLELQNQTILKQQQLEQKKKVNNYFSLPSIDFQLPKFPEDINTLSYKVVEILYDGILYYCHSQAFALAVAILIRKAISYVIIDPTFKQDTNYQRSEYYLQKKHLMTVEFLQLLKIKIQNTDLCIQGMILQSSPKSASSKLVFNAKEPQQFVNKKISRKPNFSEFQQYPQFQVNDYVLLISKIDANQQYIGIIKQLYPFKLVCPGYPNQLNVLKPFSMYKITNNKLYEKMSRAIIQTLKKNFSVLNQNTYIFWQPPSYAKIKLITEILCELSASPYSQGSILLVSNSIDSLCQQLTELGFKCLKLTPKFDQKFIMKSDVICSLPNAVFCDSLKNYMFSHIIIDDAHQISEIASLGPISKGCKKLYLIGDLNQPKAQVISNYCRRKHAQISLMQKIIHKKQVSQENKINFEAYYSQREFFTHHSSISQWSNSYFYNNQLMIKHFDCPTVKGFPWPCDNYRVSFIHTQTNASKHKLQISMKIIAHCLKSGYIKLEQIVCLVNNFIQKTILMSMLLKYFRMYPDSTVTNLTFNKCIEVIDGTRPILRDLCISIAPQDEDSLHPQKLNTSFFFAKRGIIFIGNTQFLKKNKAWNSFLQFCRSKNLLLKYLQ